MKKVFTLLIAVAMLMFTGLSAVNAAVVINVPGDYSNLQDAINAASPGATIQVGAGTLVLTSVVNVNKADLTIQGVSNTQTKIQVSGTGYRFNISASGVTIQDMEIEKTDNAGVQEIIYIGANNIAIKNNIIHGQYVLFDGTEVSRAMVVTYGISNLTIEGNTIYNLRQPAYINGSIAAPTTGNISNNVVYNTKGWVIDGANMTFTNNTWGTNSQNNYYDIAILSATDASYYPDINAISAANSNADIEDQRPAVDVLTNCYVNAGVAVTGNGSVISPYKTIAEALPRVVTGGKIDVAAGTYTENLNVTKSVKIRGANYGINPNSGTWNPNPSRVAESIIEGKVVGSTGFTLDGFTLKANVLNSQLIFLSGGTGILNIANNIFLGENLATNALWNGTNVTNIITKNTFEDFTIGSSFVLMIDGNPMNSVYSGNLFTNNTRWGMIIQGSVSESQTISGNKFDQSATAIILGSGGHSITSNIFTNSGGAIYSEGGGNSITGNSFTNTSTALYLAGSGSGDLFNSNNVLGGNVSGISVNNTTGNSLDATCNWWGTTDATAIASKISGIATSVPYNISQGGACFGGIPIITTIETPTSAACGTLDVDVTVQDFTGVANVSLVLNYDAAVLEYQSVNINTALTGAYSNASTSGAIGTFILGRNSATNEVTLAPNAVLFTLHFNIKPTANGGTTTDLTWDTEPGNNEYSSGGSNPYVYSSSFIDLTGYIIPAWLVRNTTKGTNYCTIQDAINDANPLGGDVIEALAATYTENLTIDKSITLKGANSDKACYDVSRGIESIISGSASTAVNVTADGVTIDGFEITNPAGNFAITATGRNDLTIVNNKIHHVGTLPVLSVATHAVAIVMSSTADIADVTISNNCFSYIQGGENPALTGASAKSNNGSASAIAVGWSNAAYKLSGLVIENNFISYVSACTNEWLEGGKGAYGIMINAASEVTNPIIQNNTISDLSGFWAHGIGLEGNTPGASVLNNDIKLLSATKTDPFADATGIMVEANPGAASVNIRLNSFTGMKYGIFNATAVVFTASCNWYGAGLIDKTAGVAAVNPIPWLTDGTNTVVSPLPGFVPLVPCDETAPVVTGPMDELTVSGCSVAAAPAAVTTVAALEAMGAVIEDLATADGDLVVTSSDVSDGTCPIVITRTYTITDESGNSSTIDQTITITHLTPPAEVGGPVPTASTVECEADATAPTPLPIVHDMCGTELTAGSAVKQISVTNTFDEPVMLAATAAPGVWYKDRYVPAGFEVAIFGGDSRLKESIDAGDYQTAGFYRTQGRGYIVGDNTNEMKIDVYIPSDWDLTNNRLAGFWGVAVDASNAVSGYPIVEFTRDGGVPRFRAWESGGTGGWVDMGLPTGFTTNSWITLKIRLLPSGEFLLSAGDLNYLTKTSAPNASVKLKSVILQGYNAPSTYDIYWDNFTWNDDYAALPCEGDITYTYLYQDCANLPYVWTYTYTVERSTAPSVVTPAVNSSVVYSIDDATAPTVLPVVEDVCGNELSPTIANPAPVDVITNCTGTRTYTYNYVDCADLSYEWTYTYTLSTSTINGTLVYNNTAKTIMNKVPIRLLDSNNVPVGDDITADVTGAFEFTNLCAGTYTIVFPKVLVGGEWVDGNRKDLGGINSTDAGAANAWGATLGSDPIEHVKFLAGDVTNGELGVLEGPDKWIGADDALKIQRKFVFHEDFADATPDWVYWKAGEIINHNEYPYATEAAWPTEITVVVNGNIPDLKLYGMATGDFNGSLIPTLLKSASPSLVLTENSNLQIGANQEFELPMRAASAMEVSAVSMILDIPANMVQVQDVVVNGSDAPVMWAVKGNELRIGWNSLNPVNVAENGSLVTLKLKTSTAFTQGQTLGIELPFDPLNELADGNHLAMENAALMVAKVGNQAVGTIDIDKNGGLLFSNYPNPFNKVTMLEYDLPVDGKVTINLYNNLGQLVTKLVDADQTAGQHMFRYENNSLQPGIYVAKLRLVNSETDMVGTIKLSVQK